MTWIWAIIFLGVIIFVHELGHFLVCKLVGVGVQKFSLGFGPQVAGIRRGETQYLISAVPLGGYVKMLGEEPGEELAEADRARAYNNQPVWKRMAIVGAGPVFNLAFAALVYAFLSYGGLPALVPEVGQVLTDSPAEAAGLMKGDRIVAVDGREVEYWEDVRAYIHERPGTEINLEIRRGEEVSAIRIVPQPKTQQNIFGEDIQVGLIGIAPSGATIMVRESLPRSVVSGVQRTFFMARMMILSIVKILQGVVAAENIGGPIMIVQMAGKQAAEGPAHFFSLMAFISVNLGVLNLLPIPILDGGHLLFLSIEGVRRRPLPPAVMENAQKAGLFILLLIMAMAFYNDISRILSGGPSP